MHLSLATLTRQTRTVHLARRGGRAPAGAADTSEPLAFRDLDAAERYLSHWLNDKAAFSQLRRALRDAGDAGALWQVSDREVVRALAVRLLRGSLVVIEESRPYRPWGERLVPAAAQEIPLGDVIRPQAPPLTPVPRPAAAILPLLEEVRIEGAYVLPEVLQTLEQIDLTLGSLELAGLSLEPTPSGVAPISSAMQKASASVTAAIDGL